MLSLTFALALLTHAGMAQPAQDPALAQTPAAETSQPAPTTQAPTSFTRSSAVAAAATEAEQRQAGRELVCTSEQTTGSRFRQRRCRPANLTPEERAQAADQLRRQQTSAMNVN